MRRYLLAIGLVLFIAGSALAINFPDLTGRITDNAHLLSAAENTDLTTELAAFEQKTSDQIAIVTLPDLQGQSIEDYGYQLGRHWGIGQKDKNNGLLLIVAPNEHKVRIEVGYGLEGVMTDAAADAVIRGVILPDFRRGAMAQGLVDGTHAITGILSGDENATPEPKTAQPQGGWSPVGIILIILFFFFALRHPFLAAIFGNSVFRSGSGFGSNFGSGGGFGGGFSGGGGSFGGGGASGSW